MPVAVDFPPRPGAWSATSLLREQFRIAHALLEEAIDRLPPQALHRCQSRTNVSPGICYAQVLLCEDLSVNGVLAARKPLAFSTWAGRTGLSEIPPLVGTIDWRAWGQRVRLDWPTLRRYALAVQSSTDEYIAALAEEALAPTRDNTLVWLLSGLLLSLSMRHGEITCLVRLVPSGR